MSVLNTPAHIAHIYPLVCAHAHKAAVAPLSI